MQLCSRSTTRDARRFGWAPASILVLLVLAGATAAESQVWAGRANLGVQVRSTKGGAVSGATVEVRYRRPGANAGPESRLTDSRGQANFVGLADGRWSLEIRHPEFLSFVASVEIAAGKKPGIVSQFLEATGAGRGTLKVKFLRSDKVLGQVVPGTAVIPSPVQQPVPSPPAREPAAAQVPPEIEQRPVSRPAPPTDRAETAEPNEAAQETQGRSVENVVTQPPLADAPPAPKPEVEIRPAETPKPLEPSPPVPQPMPAPTPEVAAPVAAQPEALQTEPEPMPTREIPSEEPMANREPSARAEAMPGAPDEAPVQVPVPEPMPEPLPEPIPEPVPDPLEAPQEAPGTTPAPESPALPDPVLEPGEPTQPADAEKPTEQIEPAAPLVTPDTQIDALRAYRDRTCTDCKPGEWAVTVEIGADQGEACRPTAEKAVRRAMRDVAAVASDKLGAYSGPLPLDPAVMPLALAPEAARNTLAPYLDPGSSCRLLAAVIPQGARFTGFRFEARDDGASGECSGSGECEIGRARFTFSPGIARGLGASIVYTLFENTGDAGRVARMSSFFVPAADWRP